MGLLDGLDLGGALRGALGAVEATALPTAINAVLAKTPGANLPITEDQIKTVLSNTQVQEFARHLGLPADATLKLLAQYLPDIVDKASPNGTLQSK